MNVYDFFKIDLNKTEKVCISERFKDNDGNDVLFEIMPISAEENQVINKLSKGKDGQVDLEKYRLMLVCKSVVYPKLDDSELQKFYGVLGKEKLISKMLLAGEYDKLVCEVMKISGFSEDFHKSVDYLKN